MDLNDVEAIDRMAKAPTTFPAWVLRDALAELAARRRAEADAAPGTVYTVTTAWNGRDSADGTAQADVRVYADLADARAVYEVERGRYAQVIEDELVEGLTSYEAPNGNAPDEYPSHGWTLAYAGVEDEYEADEVGVRLAAHPLIGGAGVTCSTCGTPVARDGAGAWVDATGGDGCDPGVHVGDAAPLVTAARRALAAIEADDAGDEYGEAMDGLAEALAGFDSLLPNGVLDAIHVAVLAHESGADQLQAIYALLETTGRKVP